MKSQFKLGAIALALLSSTATMAWPDVDSMNMCGNATKVTANYNGGFKGWGAHDQNTQRRGKQHHCPNVKASKVTKNTRYYGTKKRPVRSSKKVHHHGDHTHHSKAEVLDCERTERMNRTGQAVKVIRHLNNGQANYHNRGQAVYHNRGNNAHHAAQQRKQQLLAQQKRKQQVLAQQQRQRAQKQRLLAQQKRLQQQRLQQQRLRANQQRVRAQQLRLQQQRLQQQRIQQQRIKQQRARQQGIYR